jgi:hypothetical protein
MFDQPERELRIGLMFSQAEQVVGRRVREVIQRRRAAEELDRTPLNLTLARAAISKEMYY